LPAVVTIALAFGASRLARLQALMRNLRSVETLGSVTWICSDKTGTLTQNRMHVEKLFPAAASPLARDRMLAAMALCNDAVMKDGELSGDPTETALLLAVSEHCGSVSDIRSAQPRLAELPFASERMRMTTFHADSDDIIAFTKGAPEAVVSRCSRQFDSPEQAWNPEVTMQEAAVLAAEGMRVLALACRHWPAVPAFLEPDMVESEMQFLGLLALIDPPREEAATAIATCRQASITPVMITGDHPSTALAIARRLGIAGTEDLLITGEELRRLSDAALAERIGKLRVFARMDPAQKIRIVNALQDTGEFVAMTGDGVNDAPALKKADIGIAMGRNGTDVAREASDMILMDDNFATIVSAVAGGRRIYDNIRRFIRYILATNLAEVLLIFLVPFLGLPLPLLPVQILWINLVTDGLPGLALTAEKPEPDIMQRRPRPARETLFAGGLWQHLLWVGLLMSGLVLWVQQYALDNGAANWQTQVFTTMTFVQLANVMAIRSERSSTFVIGFTSNRPLLFSVVLTLVLQLALIYVPSLNDAFSTMPLSPGELLLCCVPAVLVFIAVETEKWMIRSGWLYSRMAPHTYGKKP
jgi:Ca2+-transporting ATPase